MNFCRGRRVIDRSLARQESCYSTPSSLRFKLDSEKKETGQVRPGFESVAFEMRLHHSAAPLAQKVGRDSRPLLSRQQTLQKGARTYGDEEANQRPMSCYARTLLRKLFRTN